MRVCVVGGGLSGLTISYLILNYFKEVELFLFEREERVGGKIKTEKIDEFLIENGPNGFLNSKPDTIKFIKMLGVDGELYEADKRAENRFILKRRRLVKVPLGVGDFLLSPILSPMGKLSVFFEIFRGRGGSEEESVENFVVRRLGREAFDMLIDPMVSGIYAGDPSMMEMKASFPVIYNLEKEYGGLIKGLIKKKREKKDVSAAPSGRLTTFKSGLSFFTGKIEEGIKEKGGKIFKGVEVVNVCPRGEKFLVETVEENFFFDVVISAIPSYFAFNITKNIDEKFSDTIKEIKYSPLVVFHSGYEIKKLPERPEGFGFLVPFVEGRKILGSIFISSIFREGRAPDGHFLFTTMLGGGRWDGVCSLSDGEILKIVSEEFNDILKIDVEPSFKKIVRWERAIPQYNVGHSKIIDYAKNFHKIHKNFFVTGNCFRGIGINDIVKSGFEIVKELREILH